MPIDQIKHADVQAEKLVKRNIKLGTSGPASAQASSEAKRTTVRAASSSEVWTTVAIVEPLPNFFLPIVYTRGCEKP